MSNTIRIKRSATTATPTGLAQGELAYSEAAGIGDGELFIGTTGASMEVVGGQKYVTKLNAIEEGADVTNATNVAAAGAVMEADTSTALMGFVIDEDSFVSNSATKVPTQKSVKAYVQANATSGMSYEGGYDASTNTPDLDTAPTGIGKGATYTVTVAGTFFAVPVEVGDVLIAEQATPTLEAHWTIVQANLTPATIKTQYESNSDTNALTDAMVTKLSNTSGTNSGDEVQATESVKGVAELATQTDTNTGTDDTRIVTPLKLNTWSIDGGTF